MINFSNFIDPGTGRPIAINGTPTYTTSSGLTEDGVQFIGIQNNGTYYTQVNYQTGTSYDDWGTGGPVLRGPDPDWGAGGYIQAVLPPGVTAFSVNLMTTTAVEPFTVEVSTDGTDFDTYTVTTYANPQLGYIAITASAPIQWIDFIPTKGGTSDNPLLTNFQFGTATDFSDDSQEPEPLSALLLGTGLALLAAGRYIRKRISLRAS
jgi:hypothetical protein